MVRKNAGNYGADLHTTEVENEWQDINGRVRPTIKVENQTYDIEQFQNQEEYQQDIDPYY